LRIIVAYRAIPGTGAGYATGDSMVRAFRRLGHAVYPYAKVYQSRQWIGRALPPSPDLLVRMECGDGEEQYPELGALDCPKVYWTFDIDRYPQREAAIIDQLGADPVCCANPNHVKTDWHYLPYAADPDLFYPGKTPGHGAAIIGTPFEQRADFARRAGVDLVSGVYHAAYARRLRGLAVHVHHYASGGGGLLVMRPWETMASGVLLITEADKTHELHRDIPWLTYRDADHCRQLIAADHGDLCARQYAAVMDGNTYIDRARAILDIVG